MIIHVLKYHGIDIDFMVGAPQININETIEISEKNNFILIEGDEYLSSTPLTVSQNFCGTNLK